MVVIIELVDVFMTSTALPLLDATYNLLLSGLTHIACGLVVKPVIVVVTELVDVSITLTVLSLQLAAYNLFPSALTQIDLG